MLWYFDKKLYNIWQRDLLASACFQNWIFWRFSCKISRFLQQTPDSLLNLPWKQNGFVSVNLQCANKPQSVCFFKYKICNIGLNSAIEALREKRSTVKTVERCQWHGFPIFNVNFEHILLLFFCVFIVDFD